MEENNNPVLQKMSPVMSIGEWIVTILLLALPIVNIIMLFVWAFGGGAAENPTKANFAKASLIWMAIGIVLAIIFYSSIAAMAVGMGNFM